MIKQTEIVNVASPPTNKTIAQYLYIEFTDGTSVSLDEVELKNAAVLAIQGRLSEWENEDE